MGQGFPIGENEIVLVEQLGEGNLVPKQPAEMGLGAQNGVAPSNLSIDNKSAIQQLQDDIAAIKLKLGM